MKLRYNHTKAANYYRIQIQGTYLSCYWKYPGVGYIKAGLREYPLSCRLDDPYTIRFYGLVDSDYEDLQPYIITLLRDN